MKTTVPPEPSRDEEKSDSSKGEPIAGAPHEETTKAPLVSPFPRVERLMLRDNEAQHVRPFDEIDDDGARPLVPPASRLSVVQLHDLFVLMRDPSRRVV